MVAHFTGFYSFTGFKSYTFPTNSRLLISTFSLLYPLLCSHPHCATFLHPYNPSLMPPCPLQYSYAPMPFYTLCPSIAHVPSMVPCPSYAPLCPLICPLCQPYTFIQLSTIVFVQVHLPPYRSTTFLPS